MTRNQKQKYARAVLLMQDRIALKYQKDIKRELKLTASQLAESYRINQSTVEYPQIQNEHQKRITEILLELAKETSDKFKVFTLNAKKDMFSNYVENGIYSMLATNVLTTASTVSANTIAIASVVIMQSMRESVNKPKNSQPDVIAKNISKRVGGQYSVSRAMTIARTETHKAANTAQYHRASVAAQESELEVVVEWISTNDGRVRDNHKHADGQTRQIGQPFNVGGELLMYPSDPKGSAANVINCRCVLGYDTK